MAGRGAPPKDAAERQNPRSKPAHEWKAAEGVGWQHGKIPAPPTGLMPASRTAWQTWMRAWFAFYWSPDDLPGLRMVINIYDRVERGEFQRAGELRLQMDTYGITPKGQQDRRWKPPAVEKPPTRSGATDGSAYGHLRAVGD